MLKISDLGTTLKLILKKLGGGNVH